MRQKERARKVGFFTEAGRSSLGQMAKKRLSLPRIILEG